MRVVIDTNVLISIIGKRSKLRLVWDSFIEGDYLLAVSEDILKEYEEIMRKYAAPSATEINFGNFYRESRCYFSASVL